jgi:hypothetical protein
MSEDAPDPHSPALMERRIRKIANARSITLSLAGTFVGLAVAGAVASGSSTMTAFHLSVSPYGGRCRR